MCKRKILENHTIAVACVCDGIGSFSESEIASQMMINGINSWFDGIIEYFPKVIQPILNYSPVYVVSYGPAKLFVDFSYNNFISIIIAQVIYIIISYLLCSFLYRKGVKKLNVNGG